MTQPTINNFNPDYLLSTKNTIKSEYGVVELEEYEKEDETLYRLNLRLKDLPPTTANECLRLLKPIFENPINPQLSLFVEEK